MSENTKINTEELESVAGGKDTDPFRVIPWSHGGCIRVHKTPENKTSNQYNDFVLREGDHYVVTGDTINEMTPIRVLKNNVSGYIHYSFVYGY